MFYLQILAISNECKSNVSAHKSCTIERSLVLEMELQVYLADF